MSTTIATTVISTKRIANDINGNPRWELDTERGTYRTPAGAGWVYAMTSSNFADLAGKYVVLHINGRGTVDKIV